MLYIWHRLASPVFQTVEVTYRWTLWFGCRVGWADIIRRYLTLSSVIKLGNLIWFNQKKRQRERPHCDDDSVATLWCVVIAVYHPWRGLAALLILFRWQPRPDNGVSKSKTPTSFFCIRSDKGVAGLLFRLNEAIFLDCYLLSAWHFSICPAV